MTLDNVLQDYEKIGRIYLKNDRTAIGYQAPDGRVSVLHVTIQSRTAFKGDGITFGVDIAELVDQKYYSMLHPQKTSQSLEITPEQVKDSPEDLNYNDSQDCIAELAAKACIDYALGSFGNRMRSMFATLNLRYNPFKYCTRRKLRTPLTALMKQFGVKKRPVFSAQRGETDYEIQLEFIEPSKEQLTSLYLPASLQVRVFNFKGHRNITCDNIRINQKKQNI